MTHRDLCTHIRIAMSVLGHPDARTVKLPRDKAQLDLMLTALRQELIIAGLIKGKGDAL